MITLTSSGYAEYEKIGKMYTINLQENGFTGLRSEFNKLKGELVTIDGNNFKVLGIEAYATGEEYIHSSIVLNVQ